MTAKKVYSVRVDPDLVGKAEKLGMNISAVVQNALEKLTKEKTCPTCGQKIKGK